jgi:hypothetical protein
MKRFALAAWLLTACAPEASATVVEVPPQELPPSPQATVQPTQPVVDTPGPMRSHEEWVGTYTCAQGETELILHLDRSPDGSITGVFEFSHSPSGAAGAYKMTGAIEPNGNVRLVPGPWVQRPTNYISVGMHGRVRGDTFTGRMDHASCGSFSLHR